ncbi:berberine-like protein [Colletotrichum tofieldiae]|uniref:Berberine-like protein n=1 Tax=Colletotrichum tofieldiae TaxID=708197 RepID=A0A161VLP3_9PEZI|nr:berberine-like protein [Colletotrichum tofieldiae]GKT58409.1 berberine-like protein [Colletotrichum tofieldiae]GKT78175.1 berberine-like protein [Colletotrichum tofieldiae]GKT84490.1 berberine-like protein [Colletotrichum tofieldiae]
MVRLFNLAAFATATLASCTHAQDLEACLETAGLITSFPETNASFPNDIRSWQRRITPTPAGVAWPRTTDEVTAALACAREAKVLVAARDGGHCYGSYSLPNAGLTINMTNFQEVSYDESTGLLTYGGGALVSPVVSWLWKTHGARFPHVRANMVGLVGSSIGGGFGSLSRMLGTPMDYLEGATYMLYNGTVVETSRTKNPELFWALQGAGSSYGIILSLTTKTWKPTYQQAINYTITLTDSSLGAGVDALLAIQEHYLTGQWPDELTMRWSLTAPPYTGSGFYWGNPEDFDKLLEPLVAKLPNGTQLTRTVQDFWAVENVATPSIDIPIDTFPPRSFYLQALVLREDQPFTKESATALYNFTTLAFNRTDLTKFGFIDLWGGKPTKALTDEDTSFAHANSLWLIRWEGRLATGLTDFPADGLSYMQNGFEPFKKQLAAEGVPLRGFVNYRDTALTVDQWSERLYGKNYAKLQQLKTVYDPEGMFTAHPQSIAGPGQQPPAAIN